MKTSCLLLLAVALAVGHGGCDRLGLPGKSSATKPEPAATNLLIVIVDTLRRDHLGHYGYTRPTSPFWDELAQRSVVFDNAYSAAPWTKPSTGSLLTGLYPNRHGAIRKQHRLRDEVTTLAEHLKQAGFFTLYVNGGNDHIGDVQNFRQGFEIFRILEKRSHNLGDKIVGQFAQLLEQKRRNRRFFGYVHLMDVHSPYFRTRFTSQFVDPENAKVSAIRSPRRINPPLLKGLRKEGRLGDAEKKTIIDHYDASIRYVDEQLKLLFSELQRLGLADNTYYVLAADHGEELWDHGGWYHGHTLYDELIHIPLTIGGPGLSGSRIDDLVSNVDIFPTALELLRVARAGLRFDGKAVFAEMSWNPAARELYSSAMLQGPEQAALIDETRKVIWVPDIAARVGQKLDAPLAGKSLTRMFDRVTDPAEQFDLAPVHPGQTTAAVEKLREYYRRTVTTEALSEVDLDPEVMRRLQALGYAQ